MNKLLTIEEVAVKPSVRASELARKTGFSARFFQDMAKSGKITWARQPTGERGRWVFDLEGFEQWWNAQPERKVKPREEKPCRRYTGAMVGRGARSKGVGTPTDDPSRQKMKALLPANS